MIHTVYWIRHKDHTDIFSEGYIGVSKNVEKRWNDHFNSPKNKHLKNAISKYGLDVLVKTIVIVGEEKYCYDLESKLRPNKKIGWNIAEGGKKPPSAIGNKFNLGRCGKLHPMWGRKRPDNIVRNKIMIFAGRNSGTYKGDIEATCVKTNKVKVYCGAKELRSAGFEPCAVYNCINPLKINNKTHKGHTFKRLEKQ